MQTTMKIELTVSLEPQGYVIRHEGILADKIKRQDLIDAMIYWGGQMRDAFPGCKLAWIVD